MRDGCKLADDYLGTPSSCSQCPFDDCFKDSPCSVLKVKRNRNIIKLWKQGKDVNELAAKFGVTRRTIERIIRDSKKERVQ